jgi:hypothetical protein
MIKSFNHYTKLNYGNTNIFGYLSQEILMFIKILLLSFQTIISGTHVFPLKNIHFIISHQFSTNVLEST